MTTYALFFCIALAGHPAECHPFGNIIFLKLSDCEHYRDDQGQRELLVRFRPELRSAVRLTCMESPTRRPKAQ